MDKDIIALIIGSLVMIVFFLTAGYNIKNKKIEWAGPSAIDAIFLYLIICINVSPFVFNKGIPMAGSIKPEDYSLNPEKSYKAIYIVGHVDIPDANKDNPLEDLTQLKKDYYVYAALIEEGQKTEDLKIYKLSGTSQQLANMQKNRIIYIKPTTDIPS